MASIGAREKRRAQRALEIGPERMIMVVSIDRREEKLECGHVVKDAPTFLPVGRTPIPPRFRRCSQCLLEGKTGKPKDEP